MKTIYGINSPYVARVRAALLFKELEFQHVSVNLMQQSDEWKKISPIGKIPAFEDDDGTIVLDSRNIVEYLDKKYPGYQMMGDGIEDYVKISNMISLADRFVEFNVPFFIEKFDMAEPMKKSGFSHLATIYTDQQKKDVQTFVTYHLTRAKEVLGDNQFFVNRFSAADAAMLTALMNLQFCELDISPLKKYFETLMQDEKIASISASKDEKGIKEI